MWERGPCPHTHTYPMSRKSSPMPTDIDVPALHRLVNGFTTRSAWRLETRRRYAGNETDPAYDQWRRGQKSQWDSTSPYAHAVRARADHGATTERVRIIDDPPTESQRYLLAHAIGHAELLGETVLCLPRPQAERIALPAEDWWLFDTGLVAALRYNDGDRLLGASVITSPPHVARYTALRALARTRAVPARAYADATDPRRP